MIGVAETVVLAVAEQSGGSLTDKVIIALIGVVGVMAGAGLTALSQRKAANRAQQREREAELIAAQSTARILNPQLRDLALTVLAVSGQWPNMDDLALEVDAHDAKVIARESPDASAAVAEARSIMKSVRIRADLHRLEGNRPPDDATSRELLAQASQRLRTAIDALAHLETYPPATPAAPTTGTA